MLSIYIAGKIAAEADFDHNFFEYKVPSQTPPAPTSPTPSVTPSPQISTPAGRSLLIAAGGSPTSTLTPWQQGIIRAAANPAVPRVFNDAGGRPRPIPTPWRDAMSRGARNGIEGALETALPVLGSAAVMAGLVWGINKLVPKNKRKTRKPYTYPKK